MKKTDNIILPPCPDQGDRQTGRTTNQIIEAPLNSFFVWGNHELGYLKSLVKQFNREDLQIKPLGWLDHKWFRGRILKDKIIIDHAVILREKHLHALEVAQYCYRPTEPPKIQTFDMLLCKKGDMLMTNDGTIVEYIGLKSEYLITPHIVRYSNGSIGTRNKDGWVFSDGKYMEEKNIRGFVESCLYFDIAKTLNLPKLYK